jgi:hypothetical protein
MYFTVLGDSGGGSLMGYEISIIAKKFFASLFGQSFAFAKIIKPKITDQDAARSFVILLPTKRPRQVEVAPNAKGRDFLDGGIFSEPPFLAALLTFGIDRFSVDYPYGISLSPAGMAKLTHSNADALLKLKVGAG